MKQILVKLTTNVLISTILAGLLLGVSASLVSKHNVYALANCSSQSNAAGYLTPKQNQAANCEEAADCRDSLAAKDCGITAIIINITNVLSALVGIVVVISIIIGGIQYSASSGDPQAASAAKKRIINALLALVAFGFIYAFLQWVVPGGAL